MCSTVFVYDADLLKQIGINCSISDNLKIRPLQQDDFKRGYLLLLGQLTKVGDISPTKYEEVFRQMVNSASYYITVVIDENCDKVIGTATLFTELKLIHDARKRARIEDVVVDSNYRGLKLGETLVELKKKLAKHLDCYKLTLDCSDNMIPWYQKFGFTVESGRSNFLTLRLVD